MTPFLISVYNHSAHVKDTDVLDTIKAIAVQLVRDVAPVWGLVPAVEYCPTGVTGKGIPCVISDIPDVPNAGGYHDTTGIKVFAIDGMDWRVTLSHETLELLTDPGANRWADGPNGDDYAIETCDATEGDTYLIDGIPVSNFLYPSFFDITAGADERLDHMGLIDKPFGMTRGGYQIRRTEPGRVGQIFAAHPAGSVQLAGRGELVLVFGPDFPESKKLGKLTNATKKRSRKV